MFLATPPLAGPALRFGWLLDPFMLPRRVESPTEIVKYPDCFVCGDRNPIGLQVKFFAKGETAVAEYTVGDRYEGYKGLFHGGLIAALLDEIMIKAVLAKDLIVLTAQMDIRFKKPVAVGQKILLEGKMASRKGRLIITTGTARRPDGTKVAESTGKYILADSKTTQKLKASL